MRTVTRMIVGAAGCLALALGTGGLALAKEGAAVPTTKPMMVQFPDWMAGSWIEEKGEAWSEEYWTASRAGIMLGLARSGTGARLMMWEQTQIRLNAQGNLAFYAMPRGAPASEFPVVSQTATSIIFENKAHDYPQRIRYWRDGVLLKAEISLADGSKAYGWTMRPIERTATAAVP